MTEASVEQAAAAMCHGKPIPDWLPNFTRWGVNAVRDRYKSLGATLSRAEQRETDVAILAAAQLLASWFQGHTKHELAQTVVSRLQAAGLSRAAESSLTTYLPELVQAARKVQKPREGKGRDKAFLNPTALTAHEMCAAVVIYAWRRLHGQDPPHTKGAVHEACQAVWQAAGLPPTGYGGSHSSKGWRSHIERIKLQAPLIGPPAKWELLAFLEAARHQEAEHK